MFRGFLIYKKMVKKLFVSDVNSNQLVVYGNINKDIVFLAVNNLEERTHVILTIEETKNVIKELEKLINKIEIQNG
jgi:hypothetical protein